MASSIRLSFVSRGETVPRIFKRAEERERDYDWLAAIEIYRRGLDSLQKREDFEAVGLVEEGIGNCLYRAAFQAETHAEFENGMHRAAGAYTRAAEQCRQVKSARDHGCEAFITRCEYWIASNSDEKKALLEECGRLWMKAVKRYEEKGDSLESGKASNELLECVLDRFQIEWDWPKRWEILTEGLAVGARTIANFRKQDDDYELTRALYQTGLLYHFSAYYGELDRKQEMDERSLRCLNEALALSEKVADSYLIAMSNLMAVYNQTMMLENLELSRQRAQNVLQRALKMKDNLLIGHALIYLGYINYWQPWAEEDPEKKRSLYENALDYARQAASHVKKISSDPFAGQWLIVETLTLMACELEVNPIEKHVLLEKAVSTGRRVITAISRTIEPESLAWNTKALSKALYFLSALQADADKKRRLLEEALKYAKENLKTAEQSFPFWYWYRGVGENYQALILAELADIEKNETKSRALLGEAVQSMEECIKFCHEWTEHYPQTGLLAVLGKYHDWFGKILNQLYERTGEEEALQQMVAASGGAVDAYDRADMPSRVAESFWHMARVQDCLGEYSKASEAFKSAADNYSIAAEKISRLKEYYTDFVLYMEAWDHIEKAKLHHTQQQFVQASKHYAKAAALHESSRSWGYLASNYLAWAQVESAEAQSRDEQGQGSIRAFREAAELFRETRRILQTKLDELEQADEKALVENLFHTSEIREQYCAGRIELEKAKILDKQGDHMESSEKYGSAAEIFRKTEELLPTSNRRELQLLTRLCAAWQKMMMAEARASSTMYREAAGLFEKAKEYALDQQTSLLALAHSSFCKALEAGTEFEISGDPELYAVASQHLETAGNYYLKASFKIASEFAIATQRLFEAYVYTASAKKEADPEKRSTYYEMAERVLQTSAGHFLKAKHPEKSKYVQSILKKVHEDRKLAVSLSEIMHAPTITSSTTSFATPTSTTETAVGLERFEYADVQANLIVPETEVNIGEQFVFQIELINAGRSPAIATKIEELFPEEFELVERPEAGIMHPDYLDMQGKILAPLRPEELRFVLKPRQRGVFFFKPRILYLDESRKYKSCQPEASIITVRELGISGWIKGDD